MSDLIKTRKYELGLKGLVSPSGTIPLRAMQEVCDLLLGVAERGLRLAVEGTSVKRGRLPNWLMNSLDLKLIGMKKGSTILAIEAPLLGQTAEEQIRQQDLWYMVPKADDTALTLVSRSVHDTTVETLDSDRYDGGVLDSLLQFKPFLKEYAARIELRCKGRPKEHFKLGEPELEKIGSLKAKTPEPHAVMVSGHIDAIEHSKRRFRLMLSNGEAVLGAIDPTSLSVEDLRQFWGKKATIKGTAHFRPSGRPRLVEAHVIKTMEEGEGVFNVLPEVQTEAAFLKSIGESIAVKGWLKDVWGKWPGDEPIDELLADLDGD